MIPDEIRGELGPTVERRTLLTLPALAAAPLVDDGAAEPSGGNDWREQLSFERFADAWSTLAARFRERSDGLDERYLAQLVALAARLQRDGLPAWKKKSPGDGFVGGPVWFGEGLFVVRFDMEPGGRLRPHDHPPSAVLTVCADGECAYAHYEPVGETPDHGSDRPFHVRETRRGILRSGAATSLSRRRDFVHTFEAGDAGCRLFDLVCPLSKDSAFSYVDVEGEPADVARRVFAARWSE